MEAEVGLLSAHLPPGQSPGFGVGLAGNGAAHEGVWFVSELPRIVVVHWPQSRFLGTGRPQDGAPCIVGVHPAPHSRYKAHGLN